MFYDRNPESMRTVPGVSVAGGDSVSAALNFCWPRFFRWTPLGDENSKKNMIKVTIAEVNPRNGVTARQTNPGNRAHAFRIAVAEPIFSKQ